MSCILNSPEACIRLAVRILAHLPEAEECAKAANFQLDPKALAVQLYQENARAFRACYKGRYDDHIVPITDFPTEHAVPFNFNPGSWELLAHGLAYFEYHCGEGNYPDEPAYQFINRLSSLAHEKSDPAVLAATHIWGIP